MGHKSVSFDAIATPLAKTNAVACHASIAGLGLSVRSKLTKNRLNKSCLHNGIPTLSPTVVLTKLAVVYL